MCNTYQPRSHCLRCGAVVSYQNLRQPCPRVLSRPGASFGDCNTQSWENVMGPNNCLCDDCQLPEVKEEDEETGEGMMHGDILHHHLPIGAFDLAAAAAAAAGGGNNFVAPSNAPPPLPQQQQQQQVMYNPRPGAQSRLGASPVWHHPGPSKIRAGSNGGGRGQGRGRGRGGARAVQGIIPRVQTPHPRGGGGAPRNDSKPNWSAGPGRISGEQLASARFGPQRQPTGLGPEERKAAAAAGGATVQQQQQAYPSNFSSSSSYYSAPQSGSTSSGSKGKPKAASQRQGGARRLSNPFKTPVAQIRRGSLFAHVTDDNDEDVDGNEDEYEYDEDDEEYEYEEEEEGEGEGEGEGDGDEGDEYNDTTDSSGGGRVTSAYSGLSSKSSFHSLPSGSFHGSAEAFSPFAFGNTPGMRAPNPSPSTAAYLQGYHDSLQALVQLPPLPASEHDAWVPAEWGPPADLAPDVAFQLDYTFAESVFQGHRVYFQRLSPGGDVDCVLIVAPSGRRAHVVSPRVYVEGRDAVERRRRERREREAQQLELEELRAEEQKQRQRRASFTRKQCVFNPCLAADCPRAHAEGQHKPLTPGDLTAFFKANRSGGEGGASAAAVSSSSSSSSSQSKRSRTRRGGGSSGTVGGGSGGSGSSSSRSVRFAATDDVFGIEPRKRRDEKNVKQEESEEEEEEEGEEGEREEQRGRQRLRNTNNPKERLQATVRDEDGMSRPETPSTYLPSPIPTLRRAPRHVAERDGEIRTKLRREPGAKSNGSPPPRGASGPQVMSADSPKQTTDSGATASSNSTNNDGSNNGNGDGGSNSNSNSNSYGSSKELQKVKKELVPDYFAGLGISGSNDNN